MAYTKEIIRRASRRLAQAKEDRESENRQHLAEAYQRVPRIREIDRLLRQTMVQAAQAAFLQGEHGQELLEQAKQKNLSLQVERAQLVDANFDFGYLDDSPICPHCGGTGYVGSNMCECLAELCRQEQKKELAILSEGSESFSHFRLDYYSDQLEPALGTSPRILMQRTLEKCRNYAQFFTPASGNLLFIGGTGLGKTFLSACIARSVADRGYSVVYETSHHLFSVLEQVKFSGNEEARRQAEAYNSCDLLILDDLGTEINGQFVVSALYALLNDRLIGRKPMVISTNLTVEELSRRYSPQIASRLQGNFTRLTFVGSDIRVLKNRGIL